MRTLIDMARDRGAFICQSQSLNLFLSGAGGAGRLLMDVFLCRQRFPKVGLSRCFAFRSHGGAAVLHALLRVDPRPEDGLVLLADPPQGHRHSVHGGQGMECLLLFSTVCPFTEEKNVARAMADKCPRRRRRPSRRRTPMFGVRGHQRRGPQPAGSTGSRRD